MRKYDAEGKVSWEVRADSATGELSPEGDYTKVRGVSATLWDEGKPAFDLSADEGEVSKSTGKFDLSGNVSAKSVDGRTSLSCDRITWDNNERVLVATGDVAVESNGMSLGPADEARATFQNITRTMNSSTVSMLVLTSLIVQGPIHYKDNAGNMDVTAARFSVRYDTSANVYRFTGNGSPIIAKWLKQGVTIEGRGTIQGTIAPIETGGQTRYELRTATFEGPMTAELEGTDRRMSLRGVTTFSIEQQGQGWKVSGAGAPFTAEIPSSGTTLTGNRFEGVATLQGETPEWQSATFTGGVTAKVTQKDNKTGKTYTITASCPRVDISRAQRTVRLSGGARASGDHPVMGPGGAVITAPTVILTFDEAMRELVGVELLQ